MDDEVTEEEEDEGRCEGRETTVTKGRHTVGGNNNNDNYAPPPPPPPRRWQQQRRRHNLIQSRR